MRPFAFGLALNVHPLTVLAATVVGAAVGGVLGVFIAPPATAIAISWWKIIRFDRRFPPHEARAELLPDSL